MAVVVRVGVGMSVLVLAAVGVRLAIRVGETKVLVGIRVDWAVAVDVGTVNWLLTARPKLLTMAFICWGKIK